METYHTENVCYHNAMQAVINGPNRSTATAVVATVAVQKYLANGRASRVYCYRVPIYVTITTNKLRLSVLCRMMCAPTLLLARQAPPECDCVQAHFHVARYNECE